MVQSGKVSATGHSSGPFSRLPKELLIEIYSLLPSFNDVLALSSTCHQLRDCWLTEVTPIYRRVVRRSIPCERHARRFLAEQKGAVTSSSTLSAEDVVRMVKYSRFVEDAIALFETKVVSRVKTRGHRSEEYYGPGAVGHPPHLTRTERPRFISAYYRLWGLMKSKDAAERQSRLESMTLKQLVHLYELSTLPYSIGSGGEAIMPPRDPDAEPGPIFATSHRTLRVWAALERQILAHLDQIYQHIHGTKLNPIWANAGNKGLIGFLTIWDHWQPSLKEFICGRRRKEPPYRKVLHLELWEDSSGEE